MSDAPWNTFLLGISGYSRKGVEKGRRRKAITKRFIFQANAIKIITCVTTCKRSVFEVFWSYLSVSPYFSVCISVFSGPYYSVSLRIKSECVKTRTRRTPNTDIFQAVCFPGTFVKIFRVIPSTMFFFWKVTEFPRQMQNATASIKWKIQLTYSFNEFATAGIAVIESTKSPTI